MDSVEARHQVFLNNNQQVSVISLGCFKTRNKSPVLQKQTLLQKIKKYQIKNNELEAKNHMLLNTVSDLKKLLQTCSLQNDEYIKQIEEENVELKEKFLRVSGALKYAHKNGKHIENCGLYWGEFLQ